MTDTRYVIQQELLFDKDLWEVIDLERWDDITDEYFVIKHGLNEKEAQQYANRLNKGEIICTCGRTGQSNHLCPFRMDRQGDYVTLCNCCQKCEQECEADLG